MTRCSRHAWFCDPTMSAPSPCGVMRFARPIGLVQMMESVRSIGRAIGKSGITLECPALLLEAGNGIGDGDGTFELLERAIDQGSMRPRAAVRDIKVVASGFGLKARRAI